MTVTIPEIRFKYAWLLASVASEVMNEKYGDGTPLMSYEFYREVAEKYQKWWLPDGTKILTGLSEILGLQFRQNIIDVNVAPWFTPISDPMVIGPVFRTQYELVNTVTHELIHRLLTDNTATEYDDNLVADWQKLFGEEHNKVTLTHIPVHATLKMLYLEVMNRPDLLAFDIEDTKNNQPYADAWGYVQANDYRLIIESLR